MYRAVYNTIISTTNHDIAVTMGASKNPLTASINTDIIGSTTIIDINPINPNTNVCKNWFMVMVRPETTRKGITNNQIIKSDRKVIHTITLGNVFVKTPVNTDILSDIHHTKNVPKKK